MKTGLELRAEIASLYDDPAAVDLSDADDDTRDLAHSLVQDYFNVDVDDFSDAQLDALETEIETYIIELRTSA